MIDAEVNLTGNFALAMSNVNKFLEKYPDGINQTSVASYISDASKGKKTITAQSVIDDIVQNYINQTALRFMPIGNPGVDLLKQYIREQIEGQESKQKVTTKISKVVANNYNNAVLSEASNTSYFFNIKDVIGNGKTENVLLAFTAGTPGETDVVQWEVSPVSDEKNQSDLPKIQREAQREQAEGRIDQVAVVVRPENVPGGKARIYITSTANLSEDAQQKVIDLVLEKNYDAAKEIVAASQQRRGNDNPSFLEFNTFENGDTVLNLESLYALMKQK